MSGADSQALYLDDLTVGQIFVSPTHEIDAAQIEAFAQQFDPQPFHLDAEAAKATFFSGLAASGWHVAAITMKLLVSGGAPIAGGIVGAGGEISWPKPTRRRPPASWPASAGVGPTPSLMARWCRTWRSGRGDGRGTRRLWGTAR